MNSETSTIKVLQQCHELGFDLAGVCRAESAWSFTRFGGWLDSGKHAGMSYLAKYCDARSHPDSVLAGVKSLIVVGRKKTEKGEKRIHVEGGTIARYAQGRDYHLSMREKLAELAAFHQELFPTAKTRFVVDTAPILEREYAYRAGLGWFGKNTMLINDELGSDFFLGILLSTAELAPTKPAPEISCCGSCQKCVDACPTGALNEPYFLDAGKCLNYWNIEHRGKIPEEIAGKMENRLFGCDVCQRICPFNREKSELSCKTCQPSEKFHPDAVVLQNSCDDSRLIQLTLDDITGMDEETFQNIFRETSILRLGLDGLKRNAEIVRNNITEKSLFGDHSVVKFTVTIAFGDVFPNLNRVTGMQIELSGQIVFRMGAPIQSLPERM